MLARELDLEHVQPLVDLDQALLVRLVHAEADGDEGEARPGGGVDVLDAGDAPHRPLQGLDDPRVHLRRAPRPARPP